LLLVLICVKFKAKAFERECLEAFSKQ